MLLVVLLASAAGTATATHLAYDTEGHTTVEQTLVPIEGPDGGFTNLKTGPGEPYVVRDGTREGIPQIPDAQDGRDERRRSLAYVSQLTDFQLADEESPARVEFVDPGPASAWRPQEGFTPFQIEATVRQINHFAAESPIPQGDGTRNAMDFALLTGDQADNQHLNETVWVRDLLEGNGPLNFNSGLSDPADYTSPASLGASCAAFVAQEGDADAAAEEGARYTGVQDYDDYPLGAPVTPLYYDPDEPLPPDWADWPEYDGLMDRAQQIEIDPEGLDVPFYITNGNHDVLVQGNEDANKAFEDIATGCFKALGTTNDPTQEPAPPDGPDPNYLLSPLSVGMLIPPDPASQLVSKPQIKDIYGATDEGPRDDDHGFAYVDPDEEEESGGAASYYAWNPEQTPGMRFISIDTNSEGGQTAESFVPGQPSTPGSSNGNLDDPQFQWLKRELVAAKARDQLVVLFGHHPVRSMNTQIRDEQAVPCSTEDDHGHDQNPGCDHDERPSDDDPDTAGFGCLHNGTDAQNSTCPGGDAMHESFEELMGAFPNVVAYVPGHTHEHRLTPFVRPDGTTWWEVNTSAVIDPPNQSRLIDLMDNRDGTLSIFNTVVDHAAPATAPPDCPDDPVEQPDCAAAFDEPQLASIGRTLSYNDPDNDHSGKGRLIDRNAELLLEDPRPEADLSIEKADAPDPVAVGDELTYTLTARNNGPSAGREIVVNDRLPTALTVRSVTPSQGTCERSGVALECQLGELAGGAAATVTIKVVPDRQGELVNEASIRGNVSDRVAANDSTRTRTTVGPRPPEPPRVDGPPVTLPPPLGRPPQGRSPASNACAMAAVRSIGVRPRGRRVRVSFARRPPSSLVSVDVFQTSIGRRVLGERLVARFARREQGFTWNGRANRRGRRVRDGYYFVRLRARGADGRVETRRETLRRRRGRWSERPAFYQRTACGLLSSFKLERPVFGGRTNRALHVAYRLASPAYVRVDVLRGTRLVKRFAYEPRRANLTHRLRFDAEGRQRGDYRVRVTAVRPGQRVVRSLISRRL